MAEYEASNGGQHWVAEHTVPTAFCKNSRYLAFAIGHKVIARRIDHDGFNSCVTKLALTARAKIQLALSDLVTGRLAISHGSQVSIYDLDDDAFRVTIIGVGRSVTSLAWSRHDPHELVTGLIDGSICLWNLNDPTRPLRRFISVNGVCCCLSFSPEYRDVVISAHNSTLVVWSLRHGPNPLQTIHGVPRIQGMVWNTSAATKLLTLTPNKGYQIWSLTSAAAPAALDNIDGNDPLSDPAADQSRLSETADDPEVMFSLRSTIDTDLLDACWFGNDHVIALLSNGIDVVIFEQSADHNSFTDRQLFSALTPGNVVCLHETLDGQVFHLEAPTRTQIFVLRSSEAQDLQSASSGATTEVVEAHKESLRYYSAHEDHPNLLRASKGMYPDLLPFRGHNTRRVANSEIKLLDFSLLEDHAASPTGTNPLPVAVEHTGTSGSDENPVDKQGDSILQMNRPSLGTKEETIASRRGAEAADSTASLATQGSHDSDSDEEVFGHDVRGSGTLVPDGVNVPLPKACGALFGANGQLVTFFPPRPRLTHLSQNDPKVVEPASDTAHLTLSRLFPTFGNLLSRSLPSEDETDSQGTDREAFHLSNGDARLGHTTPFAGLAWTKAPPVKTSFENAPMLPTLMLHVRSMDDLLPGCSAMHLQYRFSREQDESWADVCEHNAKLADERDMADAGLSWHLLSRVLLNDSAAYSDSIASAKSGGINSGITGTRTYHEGRHHESAQSDFASWIDHPFGGSWLVKQILEWAEQRADIQLLAYLSALLLAAYQTEGGGPSISLADSEKSLSVSRPDKEVRLRSRHGSGPVNLVQRDSSSYMDAPLNRTLHTSRASSRTTSQPNTPYLESSMSTPPLILPGFPGDLTKTPLSGSASPEHHRASFSAAARHYAQSITEKFYAYGSSPPLRKLGVSPNSNELSSSLPAASASWSKSVSFASATETTQESNLSSSFTAAQDGYDSDKTVEDSSGPQTPGAGAGAIVVKLKHEDAFINGTSSDSSGNNLFPPQLKAKLLMWRATYANQLRTMGLLYEAAELEKRDDAEKISSHEATHHLGIVPSRTRRKHRPVCGICLTGLVGLKQVCPECLHATHLGCLESLLEVHTDEVFTCPSGCGCTCLDLSFSPVEFVEETPPSKKTSRAVRRKASFTDPRRWRAQVEGDSW